MKPDVGSKHTALGSQPRQTAPTLSDSFGVKCPYGCSNAQTCCEGRCSRSVLVPWCVSLSRYVFSSPHPAMQCSQPISAPASARVCACVCLCSLCNCACAWWRQWKKKCHVGCRELHHVLFHVTRSSALTVCVLRSFRSFTVILRGNCGLRKWGVYIYTYMVVSNEICCEPWHFFSSLSVRLYFLTFGSSVVVGSFLSPLTLRSSLHNH